MQPRLRLDRAHERMYRRLYQGLESDRCKSAQDTDECCQQHQEPVRCEANAPEKPFQEVEEFVRPGRGSSPKRQDTYRCEQTF